MGNKLGSEFAVEAKEGAKINAVVVLGETKHLTLLLENCCKM